MFFLGGVLEKMEVTGDNWTPGRRYICPVDVSGFLHGTDLGKERISGAFSLPKIHRSSQSEQLDQPTGFMKKHLFEWRHPFLLCTREAVQNGLLERTVLLLGPKEGPIFPEWSGVSSIR